MALTAHMYTLEYDACYYFIFVCRSARVQLMGTPSYMAPESILHGMYGKEVDW